MELALAAKCEVEPILSVSNIKNRLDISFNSPVIPNLLNCQESYLGMANQLVRELSAKQFRVSVIFYAMEERQNRYRCMLIGNVLNTLRDRFQDRMKMSVFIEVLPKPDPPIGNACKLNRLVSAEGITISATGTCYLTMTNFDLKMLQRNSPFCLTIAAIISDDGLLAIHLQEKIRTNKRILEEGLASDVTITAGNGVQIKGHKCFLSANSSVFKTMLGSGLENSKSGEIDMTDMSEEGVRAFLRFLYYRDRIGPEHSAYVVCELLHAAHKYNVPELEEEMKTHLMRMEDFSIPLAFKIYMIVRNMESATELKNKVAYIMRIKLKNSINLTEYEKLFRKSHNDAMELTNNPFFTTSLKSKIAALFAAEIIRK